MPQLFSRLKRIGAVPFPAILASTSTAGLPFFITGLMIGHDLFMGSTLAPNWHLSQGYSVMGRTVNPLAYAFSGSNPLLPIAFNPA